MPKSSVSNWLSPSFGLIALEGVACLVVLLQIPGDPSSQVAFGYSLSRLAMAAVIAAGVVGAVVAAFLLRRQKPLAARVQKLLSSQAAIWVLLAASFAGLAFCLNWRYAAPELQASLERIFPLGLFVTLAFIHLLLLALLDPGKERQRRIALLACAILLNVFYVNATLHYSVINREYWLSDQEAYLQFAQEVHANGFPYSGDRVFMPAYPYLQSFFLDFNQDTPALFAQAKSVNIFLSLLLLPALFLISRRYFNVYISFLFTSLVAFTLSIYKAAYVQPEILFYSLNFVAFILMLEILIRPRWHLAVLAGLTLAIAHLTKASILPAVMLFVFAMLAQIVSPKSSRKFAGRAIASFALLLLVFVASLFPYLRESKARYGQYFYNVTSTFYIWYDSWSEVRQGTRAHGDAVGWPDMPAEEIPSLQKYLREHTAGEITNRFVTGYVQQARNIAFTFALVSFPLIFLAAVVVLAAQRWPRTRSLILAHPVLVAFVFAYFGAYLTLFAWYAPIAEFADQRFTYGLYIPFLFCAFFALQILSTSNSKKRKPEASVRWLPAFYSVVAILLAADILLRVPIQLSAFHWFGK
ncbi:MAG: hypothetical protein WEC37_04000 [Anaerolineales bacterium]